MNAKKPTSSHNFEFISYIWMRRVTHIGAAKEMEIAQLSASIDKNFDANAQLALFESLPIFAPILKVRDKGTWLPTQKALYTRNI